MWRGVLHGTIRHTKKHTIMDVIFDTNIYTRQPALFTIRNWSSGSAFLHIVFWRTEEEKAYEFWYALPMSDTSFAVNLIDVYRTLLAEGVNIFEMDYETYGEDKVTIYDTGYKIWQYAGTIDPTKILRPFDLGNMLQIEDTMASLKAHYPVVLPTVMLRGESIARVVVEMWRNSLSNFLGDCYYLYGTNIEPLNVDTKNLTISLSDESWNDTHFDVEEDCILFVLHGESGYTISKLNMQPQECGKQYAAVEWVSQYGVTRRHIFEVVKQTAAVDGVISIETIDNGWDERKGSVHGCTLRLEELNRYDYWYYADLILADTAKITFDGVNWYTLQVTAKNYTLPNSDSGQLSTLEIPINYCRYDTI